MDKIQGERITLPVLAVIGLWSLSLLIVHSLFDEWEMRGQVGDSFGAVNALFTGLAFAGVIYTIIQQGKQLRLQRVELALQRKEMAASRVELAAQVKAQQALFLATVAQIRVVAKQAHVEAIKIDAERVGPGFRTGHVAQINVTACDIDKIASDVEAAAGQLARASDKDTERGYGDAA